MKLTLAEIAKHYKKTPKTFSRHVKRLGIPHEMLGRSPMFDLVTVEAHLTARLKEDAKVVKFRPTMRKSRASRFAVEVGL